MTYTIEPTNHWIAGDRAYCVRGLKLGGKFIVETGRVYSVSQAKQVRGMMPDALRLAGVDTGEAEGFWSSRFVCLRGKGLAARQIAARTRHGWSEAYSECRDARSDAQAMSAGTAKTEGLGAKPASAVAESDAP